MADKKYSDFSAGSTALTQIALTGNPSTGALGQVTLDALLGQLLGTTKIYIALLTQSGTDAPVATVLKNSLGGTVVWTREDAGQYTATLAGAFTSNKTFLLPYMFAPSGDLPNGVFFEISTSDACLLHAIENTSGSDNMLFNFPILILVFP